MTEVSKHIIVNMVPSPPASRHTTGCCIFMRPWIDMNGSSTFANWAGVVVIFCVLIIVAMGSLMAIFNIFNWTRTIE